jgi:hypothetical protein
VKSSGKLCASSKSTTAPVLPSLAEFNEEMGRRLAALDRGDTVHPADARSRLERKSEQRRKLRP